MKPCIPSVICTAICSAFFIAPLSVNAIELIRWSTASGGNGHFYGITDSATDWFASENSAIALGGHLASVTSAPEQAFIEANLLTGSLERVPVWLGLNDSAQEGAYVWTTGEAVVYTNWSPGEPNDNASPFDEDYAVMNYYYTQNIGPKGLWNDAGITGVPNAGNATGPYRGVVEVVPEPTSALLIVFGGLCIGFRRRDRVSKQAINA